MVELESQGNLFATLLLLSFLDDVYAWDRQRVMAWFYHLLILLLMMIVN